jgi:hypothetical protein
MISSTEQTETVANTSIMDTSTDIEGQPVNGIDEESTGTDNKASKRKRSTKKAIEPIDNISNGRPKRNLSKRK